MNEAIERLREAREKVPPPQSLAKMLNRAPRTARRYLSLAERRWKTAEKEGETDGMLPLIALSRKYREPPAFELRGASGPRNCESLRMPEFNSFLQTSGHSQR